MSSDVDVIVLGGGIVGASAAYALLKQGQSVCLIDQFAAGHKQGSSHGDGRVVRFNYTESIYVEMAMLGYQAWDALSAAAGQPLLHQTGLLEYGPIGEEAIQVTETILKQYDIDYERLSVDEARVHFPQYRFADDCEILYQPGGAVARATPAVLSLWRLVAQMGGITQSETRIETIEVASDRVTLTARDGRTFKGRQLVMAMGGWSKDFAAQLSLALPLEVTQEILAYFPPEDDAISHEVGEMPVMIDYFTVPESDAPFYSLPIMDVPGVKMGWHHSGVTMHPDDDRRIVSEITEQLQKWSERRYPHLSNEAIQVDTCLYTNTPDYHFVLDKHPQYDNVTIAAGFSGHGFKFGPLLGELLANLVLGQATPVSLETFSLARFQNPDDLERRIGA